MAEGSLAIYQRLRVEQADQKPVWRYKRIEEKRGGKTGHLTGPFYIRPTREDGSQPWVTLDAQTFEEAKAERNNKLRGAELAAENSAGRTLIGDAVAKFMDQKRRKKSAATASNYEFILNHWCPN